MSSADDRGWGPGWPNCQGGNMIRVTGGGVTVNCRREIARLVERALVESAATGYVLKQDQTGAFACRPIGGTGTASNHSWGLALDLNWQENPFTRDPNAPRTITLAVVNIWKRHGFSWGGDWSGKQDYMHMEFRGTPGDAAALTARLTQPTPKPPEDDMFNDADRAKLAATADVLDRLERRTVRLVEDDRDHSTWLVLGGVLRTKVRSEDVGAYKTALRFGDAEMWGYATIAAIPVAG